MAKQSQINRDSKRKKLIAKYAERRAELRQRLNDTEVSIEEATRKFKRRIRNQVRY